MPKPGYKTFTVKEQVFDEYYDRYQKRRKEFKAKGISFSSYVTGLMAETMANHKAFEKHAPFLEKIAIEFDRVIVRDNKRNRIADIMIRNGELQCLLDERDDCIHIGFAYSLSEVYDILEKNGIKMKRRL